MSTRYIYHYKSHQPALYQVDAYTYRIGGHTAQHWIDGAYGYRCNNHQSCFWIDGKFIYPISPDGTPVGDEPVFYYSE